MYFRHYYSHMMILVLATMGSALSSESLISHDDILLQVIRKTKLNSLMIYPNPLDIKDMNLEHLVNMVTTSKISLHFCLNRKLDQALYRTKVASLFVIEDGKVLENTSFTSTRNHVILVKSSELRAFQFRDPNIGSKFYAFTLRDNKSISFVEIYNIESEENAVKRKICRSVDCELVNRLKFRKNLRGYQLKVLWGHYTPYSMKNENGNYNGIIPDLLDVIANHLNFTTKVTEGKHWGSIRTNGSWNGMIGEIMKQNYDLAMTGFSVTNARRNAIDFLSLPELRDMRTLLVRTPNVRSISIQAYIKQFSPQAWLCTLGIYVVNASIMWLTLSYQNPGPPSTNWKAWPSIIYFPLEAVYYALIGKKSRDVSTKSLSVKICLFTAFGSGMLFLASYRAVLNAFLSVKSYKLPIEGFDDILSKDFEVLTYQFSSEGDIFRHAKSNTLQKRIYTEKIEPYPKNDIAILGIPESVKKVINEEKVAMFTNMAQIHDLDEYPCQIMDISNPSVQYLAETSVPIFKGHPLKSLIDQEIRNLVESGIVDRIINKYRPPEKKKCKAPGESLALENTFFPFALLIVGVTTSVIIMSAEYLQKHLDPEDLSRDNHDALMIEKMKSILNHHEMSNVRKLQTIRRMIVIMDEFNITQKLTGLNETEQQQN